MRHTYTAWVSNDQGATEDIEYNGNTSKSAIIKHVRATYGAGWTLHIRDIDGGEDLVTLTLRK